MVRRVEARFQALGKSVGVSVASATPEAPVLVQGEPSLVERAIGNLVHNAVIRGGQNVAVVLDVIDGRFLLTVANDGPGLLPEQAADLSRRTFLDDPSRPRGQGLGVAITNDTAHRLDWSLSYAPGEEGGLCVTLHGPVR